MVKLRQRIAYMDALRLLSALTVVMIHAVNPVTFSYGQVPLGAWWIADFLNVLGRASVPLFVMLSGALLLDRSRQTEPDSLMFKRRTVHVVWLFVVWSAIYFAWRTFGLGQAIDAGTIANDLVAGTPGEQLYFLPLIAGLYVITPLLRPIVWKLPWSKLAIYTCMLMVLAGAWQLVTHLPGARGPDYNVFNQFVPFIGYYLLGFLLASYKRTFPVWLAAGSYLIGLVVSTVVTYVLVSHSLYQYAAYFMYDFINLFVALQAIGAWLLISRCYPGLTADRPRLRRTVSYLATATLSLYLVHVIVLEFISTYLLGYPADARPYSYLLIEVVGGGSLALLVAVILTKVPLVKRLVT